MSRPIRTRPPDTASTVRCRTCRSSRARSSARRTRRWCGRARVVCGETRAHQGHKGPQRAQRTSMKRVAITFLVVVLPIATALAQTQPGVRSESGIDLALLDKGADPCVDFYAYACGGWTKNQPIPADRSAWGVAERLQEQNETRLRTILEAAAKSGASGEDPETKKIGDYYASCVDEPAINGR